MSRITSKHCRFPQGVSIAAIVLVIDYGADVRDLLQAVLDQTQYKAVYAVDGEEAIRSGFSRPQTSTAPSLFLARNREYRSSLSGVSEKPA